VEDSARPPVLAHLRFAADRASFQGLDLRACFERIHTTNLWGAAASVSGLGSEPSATTALAAGLPPLLRQRDPLPRADAVLCRDCLVHLSFAHIERVIHNLRRSGATWLITTTFSELQANHDCDDGDWRALNFCRPPFAWPAPVALLDERCDEAGGGYRDKGLGVWRLDSL